LSIGWLELNFSALVSRTFDKLTNVGEVTSQIKYEIRHFTTVDGHSLTL